MLVDYHIHLIDDSFLDRCPYNLKQIEKYLREAQAKGIEEICFTDHCNRFMEFKEYMSELIKPGEENPSTAWISEQFYEPLERYAEAIYQAQQKGWPVKMGLEIDYLPRGHELIPTILRPYPFDYLLGSIHYIDNWGYDVSKDIGWPEKDVEKVYYRYFALVHEAIGSKLFDGLAHLDLIKKFGHQPKRSLEQVYQATAELLSQNRICLEINSAGLRRGEKELYPSFEMLCMANKYKVAVTFGSDAHYPKDVAAGFHLSVESCLKAGYQSITRFSRRQPENLPL
jgi:histidinol-phosphatase (PHP family)